LRDIVTMRIPFSPFALIPVLSLSKSLQYVIALKIA
jgi:hypothetical protein